jgi:hypothetical protein
VSLAAAQLVEGHIEPAEQPAGCVLGGPAMAHQQEHAG